MKLRPRNKWLKMLLKNKSNKFKKNNSQQTKIVSAGRHQQASQLASKLRQQGMKRLTIFYHIKQIFPEANPVGREWSPEIKKINYQINSQIREQKKGIRK